MRDIPPISITMVTGSLSRQAGGMFHSVRMMAKSLRARGHNVYVIGTRDTDTEADLPAWRPLQPIVLNRVSPRSLGFVSGLSEAISSTKPDIIHQHGIWLGMSYVVSQFALRCPTVVSPRGMLDKWARRNSGWKKFLAWQGWERRNLCRATFIHALSKSEADSVRDVLPFSRIEILPNAITLPPDIPIIQHSGRRKILLFLGRIHPKKGLSDLFFQWVQLPAAIRNEWKIVVAGPSECGHRPELQKLVHELNISSDVDFVGPLHGIDKEIVFRNADAFILPSYSEGLPIAVLEAWSYKLPVFMTDACNLPEGFTSYAALPIETGNNPRLLKEALECDKLTEVGVRGYDLVVRKFSWEQVAAELEALYFTSIS